MGSEAPRAIAAPVSEVTLLEDRAHVVRRARLALPSGVVQLRVAGVAPTLADRTLTARLTGDGGTGRVNDLRVRRSARIAAADRPAALRELEAEREKLDDRRSLLRARKSTLDRELSGIDELAALVAQEIAEDAGWGRSAPAEWSGHLDGLAERDRAARAALGDLAAELEKLEEQRGDLIRRIQTVSRADADLAAELDVELLVGRAGTYELRIDYVVPGACWRPQHTAQLVDGERPRLLLDCDACVWQNSGEAWTDVELAFSTERASLGVDPPALGSDVLRARRKAAEVLVQTREQEVQQAGLGAGPAEAGLPGIDDGGAPVHLRAAGRATIPSDGRPYRVRLFSFESEAQAERIALPELAEAVLFKSVQVNRGPAPLLAGPVDLVRQSGLVGRGKLLFVGVGERFALGWGPDATLRVHREVEIRKDESRMLSSWITRVHQVEVHLSNIGPHDAVIALTERVPVSEIDKVQVAIDRDETSDGARIDDDGFATWTVSLRAFARETVTLTYRLRRHEDVVGL